MSDKLSKYSLCCNDVEIFLKGKMWLLVFSDRLNVTDDNIRSKPSCCDGETDESVSPEVCVLFSFTVNDDSVSVYSSHQSFVWISSGLVLARPVKTLAPPPSENSLIDAHN